MQDEVGTYEGEFDDGVKHGFGEFCFKTGLRYIGEYKQGIREGNGKIINKNQTVAYDGEFKNNMPHGKGMAPGKEGEMKEREWADGIDKELVE